MNAEGDTQIHRFDWDEVSLANCIIRAAKRHKSFSPSAEQVLKLATQAALSLKHDAVGAEHLLAGVLKFNSGHANEVLRRAGLTLPVLREEIESERGASQQNKVKRPIPYTPRSKSIIQRAEARIRGLTDVRVEVEDLLLELLVEKDGLPARIFRKRAIDVEAMKNALAMKRGDE